MRAQTKRRLMPDGEPISDDTVPTRPSKTRRKAAMHELQALGDALVELTDHQLSQVPLPEDLLDAVKAARSMRRLDEARRRQLQFIGRLMRDVDPEPIRARIDSWQGQSLAAAQRLHEIERWRERLLTDPQALTELASEIGPHDLQSLRNAVREAQRERAAIARGEDRALRHYRELFRLLRTALEAGKEGDAVMTRDLNDD